MKKNLFVVLASLLAISSSLTSCGSTTSSKLAIVHFDQSILGDTQKDLGVSIAVKKGNSELQTAINSALDEISSATRLDLMTKAVTRSSATTIENEEGKQVITTAPYDSSKKDLIVGLECDYAPFNWTDTTASTYSWPIDGQSNQFAAGYDISIARLIAEKLDYNLVIRKLAWESLIPSVQNGTINCVIAGMTDTEERRQSVDFTNEYYRSELVLVVKEDSKYYSSSNVSLSSFEGAKFVSQVSTVTDDVIENWVSEFKVTHLSAMDTFATCALAVKNGTADVMTAELPVAQAIVGSSN